MSSKLSSKWKKGLKTCIPCSDVLTDQNFQLHVLRVAKNRYTYSHIQGVTRVNSVESSTLQGSSFLVRDTSKNNVNVALRFS